MLALLSSNCILIGELDFYCLACCVHLKSKDDAHNHIQDLKHKEVINSIGYLATHEQDLIRKVTGIYFCEVCNITLSTLAKVKLHVTEDAHLAGKRRGALNRAGNDVIAGDVFISESAWHGLVEGTCVLCNVEGVDVTVHKCEKLHVINLINNKVIFTADNDLYRKVDDIYQCLTCNKAISEQLLNEHLNSEEHKQRFIFMKDSTDTKEQNKKREVGNVGSQPNTPKKVAVPDNSDKSTPEVMGKKDQLMSPSSIPKFLETFDKEHGLIIKNENTVYCNICSIEVLATIDGITKHVASYKHTDNKLRSSDSNKQNRNVIEKVMINKIFQKIQFARSDNGFYFIFYGSICVNTHVFMGLHTRFHKVICRFCDMDISPEAIPSHIKTELHNGFVLKSSLIISLKGEFVRQIKSDMYDCGYCGEVQSDYDDMLDHLATAEHKSCRAEHEDILKELKSGTARSRIRNVSDFVNIDDSLFENMFKRLNI